MKSDSSSQNNNVAVPVLMYHSVGRVMPDWRWANLTVPASIFEDHLKCLKKAGYRTVNLDDLYDHVSGKRVFAPEDRVIVLTFDDGYIDNWTYAAPLLSKYGFDATILVTPEFVHPEPIVRATLEDVWSGETEENELHIRGFMSWEELRQSAATGVFSVQSHAMTHTWYPVSDKVVDFHHPGDGHYWLEWNAAPETKPFYLQHLDSSRVPYGVPVYEHSKSLAATRRYFPSDDLAETLGAFVASNGGDAFFDNPGWRQSLEEETRRQQQSSPPTGVEETAEERTARLECELSTARKRIEDELGSPVHYHVWPGGGYDADALEMAKQLYKAVTIGPRDRIGLANRPGEDPSHIIRRGIPGHDTSDATLYMGGLYLLEFIEEFKGSKAARRRRQILKLGYLAALKLGLWRTRSK